MTESNKQKEERDSEASSKKRETKSVSNFSENWIEGLAKRLKIGSAKNKGPESNPEDANEGPRTMSHEQIDSVRGLCLKRVPFAAIEQMMGVPKGTLDPFELKWVMMEAEKLIAESLGTQEKVHGQTQFHSEEAKFEKYDPVRLETAAEETTVDETPNDEKAAARNTFDVIDERVSESSRFAPIVSTLEPEFIRALKDSTAGSKPYFKKGDVLRVINNTSQQGLDDQYFELLPLKPPGEAGRALIQNFEPADQATVDAVGREARTAKEMDSFRCAMEWED